MFEKYPDLFAKQNKSIKKSTILFGIQTDDGWFNIIDALSKTITQYDNWSSRIGDECTVAIKVKEKFGSLRFYYGSDNEQIGGVVEMAMEMSFRTCELCGEPGQMHNKNNWLKTLCPACAFNHNYVIHTNDIV